MFAKLKELSLTHWIIIAFVIGIFLGWLLPNFKEAGDVTKNIYPEFSHSMKLISTIFLRMIKTIIVPLLFGTLIVGIAGHTSELKSVGRLAFRSFIYFEIATTLALAIGLIAVNVARPGDGAVLPQDAGFAAQYLNKKITIDSVIEHAIPQSIAEAAATNDVLQVVFFAIIFGIALSQVQGKAKETMLNFCESLSEVMFKYTNIVMKFAPFGVGAAVAYAVAGSGLESLINLGKLILTLYIALFVFALVVFIPIMIMFKINIKKFITYVKEPALIAFSTTSSDAALPKALQNMIEFGVPRRIVSFVLPTGYAFNLDGSTLYLAVASVFCAQAAGIELSLGQQIVIMLTLMLTSKGVAAVPRASFIVLLGTLATFGIPLEAAGLILAIDTFMDMARTTVNLIGNCLASAVMARWEGELES